MSVKMRQLVEREIFAAVAKALLDADFILGIDNGADDELEIANSSDFDAIIKASNLTDDEYLHAEKRDDSHFTGWVRFVYGNDGWDVISDYTVNLEPYIGEGTAVDKLINKYAD